MSVAAAALAISAGLAAGCGSEAEPAADRSAEETREAPDSDRRQPPDRTGERATRGPESNDDQSSRGSGGGGPEPEPDRDEGPGDASRGGGEPGMDRGRGRNQGAQSVDEALEEEGLSGNDLDEVTRPGGRPSGGGGRPDRGSPSR
jgi:hypothetical protein